MLGRSGMSCCQQTNQAPRDIPSHTCCSSCQHTQPASRHSLKRTSCCWCCQISWKGTFARIILNCSGTASPFSTSIYTSCPLRLQTGSQISQRLVDICSHILCSDFQQNSHLDTSVGISPAYDPKSKMQTSYRLIRRLLSCCRCMSLAMCCSDKCTHTSC